jgi:MFS transporter, Spinster family, sphingosine-1-phosphate transporter
MHQLDNEMSATDEAVTDSSRITTERRPAFRAWSVVGLLWPVACLNYLDRLMLTTVREPLQQSIPMTEAQFGLLTSVFLWVYAVLGPGAGFLADRFSRSRVIVGSLLVWSLTTWLTGQAHTFDQLFLARAMMGVSEACYIPAALALIADYHRGPTRSLATGLHISGTYAGAALGGLGGVMAEHFGWRAGFTLFGLVGMAYALMLGFALRDSPRAERAESPPEPGREEPIKPLAAVVALFRFPPFYLLLLANAFVGVANWGVYGWLPTFLRERFHLGLGEAGMSATGYIQVASFVGVLVGGGWADWWSRSNPRGRAYVPAIGYLVAGPCLFLAAGTALLPAMIAGLVVFGLARGFYDANLMPVLRQVADERYSATGYGFLNLISCVTGGVLVYGAGMLRDAHVDLRLVFEFCAVGLVVTGLMLLLIKPRSGSQLRQKMAGL